MRLALALFLAALPLSAQIALQPLVRGLEQPVQIIDTNDGTERQLVALQNGRILAVRNGLPDAASFADVSRVVSCCANSEGLLSLVLHPQFAVNHHFFVQYVDRDQNTAIARYTAGEPASGVVLLTVPQPDDNRPNHNGGTLNFGPDGLLYASIGDGGASIKVTDRAQHLDTLLGKIIRLDVDRRTPYAIPSSNPFAATPGARPEIWAYGLRNPWRTSFDRLTGDFWIGDVGQHDREEVDLQPSTSLGGEDYGWPLMEGSLCQVPCNTQGLVTPVIEYSHDAGRCSVTGGFRYRGTRLPELAGAFVFGDFCSGEILAASPDAGGRWLTRVVARTGAQIVSFGEANDGELWMVDYRSGTIYALTAPRRRVARH